MAKLIDAGTAASGSGVSKENNGYRTFQATLGGASPTACVATMEVSNDNVAWLPIGDVTLSASELSDGFYAEEAKAWSFVRATWTGLTGTTPTITCTSN